MKLYKMKLATLLQIVLILFIIQPLFAQDSISVSNAQAEIPAADPSGLFVRFAESRKYELTLKHGEIKPGDNAELMLYVADYATNKPLTGVDIKMTSPEDATVVLNIEPLEPGVYHIIGTFPNAQTYSLNVNLNSPSHGPDLIQIKEIITGKKPPLPEEAVTEISSSGQSSDLWKYGLVFLGGLGLGFLFLRARPRVATALLIGLMLPASFQNADAHGGVDHGDEKKGTAGDNLYISKETQFLFGIETGIVEGGNFQPSVELFGKVTESPGGFANVTTPQNGKITSIKVSPGQKVSVGQVVAEVRATASQADQVSVAVEKGRLQVELRSAQSELAAAEREVTRLRAISDIAAKKDIQAAEARYATAKANVQALQSVLSGTAGSSSGIIVLRAPVSGIVGQFSIAAGTEIVEGTELFSITNLEKVFIEAPVFAENATALKSAVKYMVTQQNNTEKTGEARLVSSALQVDPTNQAQKLLFQLVNTNGEFKIGEFVSIQALSAASDKAIFVPNEALSEINGKPVLFIKDSPESYSVSYVKPGDDNGTHTIILEGIEGSQRYVSKATYQVKMMMLNQ